MPDSRVPDPRVPDPSPPDPIAWIDHVPPGEWNGELAILLPACRDPRTGAVDHILAVHSLHPAGLAGHLALYRAAMEGCKGLPRVDCEFVALLVSAENSCHY